jgi:mRNA-degrading endonuclease RelE of RelBE toxin-antitoxin system
MSFEILLSNNFKKEAKRLSKKYRSLKIELQTLAFELSQFPTKGTALGNSVYKIRLAIESKNKGRSGGARVITFVKMENEKVLLLSIYDKSEKDNLTEREIKKLLQDAL